MRLRCPQKHVVDASTLEPFPACWAVDAINNHFSPHYGVLLLGHRTRCTPSRVAGGLDLAWLGAAYQDMLYPGGAASLACRKDAVLARPEGAGLGRHADAFGPEGQANTRMPTVP